MPVERKEPAIADTSKPILEAPVVPEYPSNPTFSKESLEDPDVLAATNHTLDYNNDTEEEILDIDDDKDDVRVDNSGVLESEEDLDDEDDDV